ncbi:MAG: hypothetical protein ACTSPK_09205 [Candidatus Heimdallarchaeota archaeon]
MKLTRKILKNRKAMTPLMIGIIVAASVIAVIFVVMAGVITVLPHDIDMTLRDGSIKGVNTQHKKLEFQIQCENEDGIITSVNITKDGTPWGHTSVSVLVDYRTTGFIEIDFFSAHQNAITAGENDGTTMVFVPDDTYVLVVEFKNTDLSNVGTVSLVFVYNVPS